MANLAYIRVSSIDQNEARQHEALKEYHIDKTFIDHGKSGKSTDRPQLKAMLDFVRAGDIVICRDITRIARNVRDLLNIVDTLSNKDVEFRSIKEIRQEEPSDK